MGVNGRQWASMGVNGRDNVTKKASIRCHLTLVFDFLGFSYCFLMFFCRCRHRRRHRRCRLRRRRRRRPAAAAAAAAATGLFSTPLIIKDSLEY